ncbi:MAG: DUF177 domain-containing protein [Pyrinomonadaceae bacterium]
MKIEVEKLAKEGGEFAHTYESEEIVLDEESARLTSPPEIRGRIKRTGAEVLVRGHIRARAEVDCDRCLKAVEVPVDTDFEATYIPAIAEADAVEAELQPEDLIRSVFDGETIDVDDLVREQVLLALPLRALCAEQCRGLCPVCGANKNTDAACACEQKEIDPRWAVLAKLREP